MLNNEQISQLNSHDISKDNDHTKAVVSRLWGKATSEQKQKAVTLGSYKNTKSFYPTKNKGQISVRMTIVLAQVFSVDPFYIIGEKLMDNGFTEEALNDFLCRFSFDNLATNTYLQSTKVENHPTPLNEIMLKDYVIKVIDDIVMTKELSELSEEEIISLIKALITQVKLKNINAMTKLSLIKRILAY